MALDDTPRGGSHGIRGKVLTLDYDLVFSSDDTTCLYCLSRREILALLPVIEYLKWPTRWYSPTGQTIERDILEAFAANIEGELMTDHCDVDTQFAIIKEKLDDIETTLEILDGEVGDIALEIEDVKASELRIETGIDSIDGQLTEISAEQSVMAADLTGLIASEAAQDIVLAGIVADLTTLSIAVGALGATLAGIEASILVVGGKVDAVKSDTEAILADAIDLITKANLILAKLDNLRINITNIYNQGGSTIINVNTYITFGASNLDTTPTEVYARYNALCDAVVQWIYLETYAVLTALDGTPEDLAELQLSIDVYLRDMAFMLSVGADYPYDTATIYAAVSDTDAVNDVACAMITMLATLSPSATNFSQALSAYSAPAYPDNRAVLVTVLNEALTFLDAYSVFTTVLAQSYTAALAAAPVAYICPPCAVGDVAIPSTFDFRTPTYAPFAVVRGTYSPGIGLLGIAVPGDPVIGVDVVLDFPDGNFSLIAHHMSVLEAHTPTSTGNEAQVDFYYLNAGVLTVYSSLALYQNTTLWPNYNTGSQPQITIPAPPASNPIARIRYHTSTPFMGNGGAETATTGVKLGSISFVS